jgi:hypothetical protein
MRSKEYALSKLDEWFSDRIDSKYTPEIAEEITERVCKSIESRLGDLYIGLLGNIRAKFSRAHQIKVANSKFSKDYAILEALIEGLEVDGVSTDIFPESERREYIDPLFDQLGIYRKFVDRVRMTANQDHRKEITARDIDVAFIDTFGDHLGFTDLCLSYARALPQTVDYLTRTEKNNKELFEIINIGIEIEKEIAPYINEKIFGDLKSR